MQKNIISIAIIVAILGLIFYAYPIIRSRYFNENTKKITVPSLLEEEIEGQFTRNPKFTEEKLDEIKVQQESLKNEGKVLYEIIAKDCQDECQGFSSAELEYCKEVCGLNPVQKTTTGCGTASGIKKDYCLKDLAINKKDFAVCDKISDENIKKSCENRIIEEILDNS